MSAERDRAILEYAKAAYVAEDVYRDPSLTKGIDNALLLLLRLVIQTNQDDTCTPDNVGFRSADRLMILLRQQGKLPRAVRRWLKDNEYLFVALGEHIATALDHDPVPSPPAGPTYREIRFLGCKQVTPPEPEYSPVLVPLADGSVACLGSARMLGEWTYKLDFIEKPLPDWWHGWNRRLPSRAAVLIDQIAHRILCERHS